MASPPARKPRGDCFWPAIGDESACGPGRGRRPEPSVLVFPVDLARALVRPQPAPRGMAQVAVGSPLRVSDLTDELGTHPDRVAGVGAGERGRERIRFLPKGRKTRGEVVEHAF